jgi:putative protease
MTKLEIMAPVGNWESLDAAIKGGANSIYFGISQLNMRSRSNINFTIKDLKKISKICNKNNVKKYLALNVVMYDSDINKMRKICDSAKEAGINALIISDIAAINYARSIGLNIHMSTQCNISNIESIKFYSQFANVIVLARELSLSQIKKITDQIKKEKIIGPNNNLVRIEVFCHGAMCVAISGKCYMSLATYNASANKGRCMQNCRRSYIVKDAETGEKLKIENKFVMSPKDMCTIDIMDKIIKSGATVFKIEGRGRSPEYAYTVTKCYREAADSILNKTYTKTKVKNWTKSLRVSLCLTTSITLYIPPLKCLYIPPRIILVIFLLQKYSDLFHMDLKF